MKDIPANIRRMAHDREFRVTLRIGRSGLTDAMHDELDAQLRSLKVVNVKMNKGLTDERDERRQLFEQIAEWTVRRVEGTHLHLSSRAVVLMCTCLEV